MKIWFPDLESKESKAMIEHSKKIVEEKRIRERQEQRRIWIKNNILPLLALIATIIGLFLTQK